MHDHNLLEMRLIPTYLVVPLICYYLLLLMRGALGSLSLDKHGTLHNGSFFLLPSFFTLVDINQELAAKLAPTTCLAKTKRSSSCAIWTW